MERGNNIHALQGVHGLQSHRALRELLSCPPHQRGQQVPEVQRDPGKERKVSQTNYVKLFPYITHNGE